MTPSSDTKLIDLLVKLPEFPASDEHSAALIESAPAELRQRFDQHLACLLSPDAGDRLRNVMRTGT